jgi:hypothetical protein
VSFDRDKRDAINRGSTAGRSSSDRPIADTRLCGIKAPRLGHCVIIRRGLTLRHRRWERERERERERNSRRALSRLFH